MIRYGPMNLGCIFFDGRAAREASRMLLADRRTRSPSSKICSLLALFAYRSCLDFASTNASVACLVRFRIFVKNSSVDCTLVDDLPSRPAGVPGSLPPFKRKGESFVDAFWA